MKIDNNVERAVRETYAGVVGAEPERFEAGLLAISGDEGFARQCLQLAVTIDTYALLGLHGGRPDDEQLAGLAATCAEDESWSDVSVESVSTFLTALANQAPVLDALPAGDAVELAFVVGGWLLAAFVPDDKDWTDFLDEILQQLESAQ